MTGIGSVVSDVGQLYSSGLENLFGGLFGQRKLVHTSPSTHSSPRKTQTDPDTRLDPYPDLGQTDSGDFQSGRYTNLEPYANENDYQNWDTSWEQEQESNFNNDEHELASFEKHFQQAEDLSPIHKYHEYTSSEAQTYDYSLYDYDSVPNYFEEVAEDDFRYCHPNCTKLLNNSPCFRPSAKLQTEFQSGSIGDNQFLSGNWESNFPFEELAKKEKH